MLPVNNPLLDGNEKKYLIECIETGWISSEGPFVEQFENDNAAYLGVKYGVAVSNGTAALEAAIYALGIRPGDEVIMPAFTIISCAIAVLRFGGKPVLVDIEGDTWNIDISRIEEKITPNTKAIMAVHMYGHPADMDPILEIAKKYDLKVIEDSSQVHGASYKGRKCGSLGDISTFSFYANKLVTTGEGGMVVTSDEVMAQRARDFRNLCHSKERRFLHYELGENLRMTNLQAALGVAQLERLDEFVAIKRTNGALYRRELSRIPGVKFQMERPWANMVYWMYSLELPEDWGVDITSVITKLGKVGIGTRPFFVGMHNQPILKNMGLFGGESYPVSDRAEINGFYLPSGMSLSEDQIIHVVDQLKIVLDDARVIRG